MIAFASQVAPGDPRQAHSPPGSQPDTGPLPAGPSDLSASSHADVFRFPDEVLPRSSEPSPDATSARTSDPGLSARLEERAELEALGDRIATLAAHLSAATWQLLVMLREFDERGGWPASFRSCAHWLSWRTGIAPGAAREKLRVAHALKDLPLLSEELSRGRLSYSAARALTRIARPENEEALVSFARHATAAQLERMVSGWRQVDGVEEEERLEQERHQRRELWIELRQDGSYAVEGRLDPEVGALLVKALEAAEEVRYPERSGRGSVPRAARWADALGTVAEAALAGGMVPGQAGDRYQVVLHVGPEALRAEPPGVLPPESRLERGPRVSAETARRLSCDAGRVAVAEDGAGSVLDVGRKTRTIPTALRRALERRDGGCRFPACTNRFCDAHHVVHWADGGVTSLSNTVLLCRTHHRAVHEDGLHLEMGPEGQVRIGLPDGTWLDEVPPPAAVEEDPAARIGRSNAALGLEIDAWTATTLWRGDRLDRGWAVYALRTASKLASAARDDVSPDSARGQHVSAETGPRHHELSASLDPRALGAP